MPIIKKFHNRSVVPPRGGWSFPIQGRMISKHSEHELIQELLAIGKANGQPISAATAELEIWKYFCSREPDRCKNGEAVGSTQNDVDVLTREVWGPWIWKFLK